MVAEQYLLPHSKNQHYKTLLKAILKQCCGAATVTTQEVKDLETCIAGIKSDKLKQEKAAKDALKGEHNNALWLQQHSTAACPLMNVHCADVFSFLVDLLQELERRRM